MYNLRESYLYNMCWSDLDDNYTEKTVFYIGQCIRKLVYAYALVKYM